MDAFLLMHTSPVSVFLTLINAHTRTLLTLIKVSCLHYNSLYDSFVALKKANCILTGSPINDVTFIDAY